MTLESRTSTLANYAAIAYSPTTKMWRRRWEITNQQQAIDLVLSECEADDCRPILVYGAGTCGTFALGDKDALGVGAGPNKYAAKQAALAGCYKFDEKCKVAEPRCNR